MTDTAPQRDVEAPAVCPVDHEALARQAAEAGCPVDHEALAAQRGRKPASSVCAYAGDGKRGYLVPGLIALGALLLIGIVITPFAFSHGSPRGLDSSAVATQVADSYQATHRLTSPPPVHCPSVPQAAGTFTCSIDRGAAGPLAAQVTEAADGHISFTLAGH